MFRRMQNNMWQNNTNNPRLSPRFRASLLAVLVVIVVFVVIGIINALRFHLVTISPNLSSIGSATPYVDFKYNKNLSDTYFVSSTPMIIKSSALQGKTLRLYFNSSSITVGNEYQIIVKSISSKVNDNILNKSFAFTAKNVLFNDLSAAQKSYLVSKQDQFVYNRSTILFTGYDALINRGVSNSQLIVLQQAVFTYSKVINKQFTQVDIVNSSLVQAPYDSSSSDPLSILGFDGTIDGQTYHFRFMYSGFKLAQLQIYEKSGATMLFDSGIKEPVSD